ncbi:TPA: hypothetical protein KNT04_002678 [Clostridioides difficile]|nr:hypothetical protein [Clostridioides difficile]
MILIAGTELSREDLPFSDLIDYSLENDLDILIIKLNTIAKTGSCIKIYLNEKFKEDIEHINIEEKKLLFFKNDIELLDLLSFSQEDKGKEKLFEKINIDNSEEEIQEIEYDEIYINDNISLSDFGGDMDALKVKVKGLERTIEDKEVLLKEKNLEIEEISDSNNKIIKKMNLEIEKQKKELAEKEKDIKKEIDGLKKEMDSKNKLIYELSQKEKQIEIEKNKEINELKKGIEELNNLIEAKQKDVDILVAAHKEKILEIANENKDKIDKANENITILLNKLEKERHKYTQTQLNFLKYYRMADTYNASSKVEFSEDEKKILLGMESKLHIFVAGTDNSLVDLIEEFTRVMDKKNILVVDFTNILYFRNAVFKADGKKHSLLLNTKNIKIEELTKSIGKSEYITTSIFNDITFLTMDWFKIIKKLMDYSNGRDIVFLFNNISSFSVRHTISKLASVGELDIFVKCNPIYLSNMLGLLKFIPNERVRLIVMQYIDVTKTLVDMLRKEYKLFEFSQEIIWKDLNL